MKAADEIPADISKEAFSELLADRMLKAARTDPSIRPS
jgi:hypothetical protein